MLFTMMLAFAASTMQAIRMADLRTELLQNPWGIDNVTPHLSWKILLDKNGIRQTAYQVIAASEPDLLTEEKADLWNSGKVESQESLWIKYGGKALNARSVVYWKVRLWDDEDKASAWSPVAHLSVGLLAPSDWQAAYIGAQRADTTATPMFRKKFNAENLGRLTLLHINTLGYHEVYLNGQRVAQDALVPAVSEVPKRSLVMTYDVTPFVREGVNDLVIWASKGWFEGSCMGGVPGGPYVKAQVETEKGKQWQVLTATDKSWKVRCGGYYEPGQWGRVQFQGEVVRGSELPADFEKQTLDNLTWQPVIVPSLPDRLVTPMMCEPNVVQAELKPVLIKKHDAESWIIDMGKSVTGWTKIHFGKLRKGQRVKMIYTDMLNLNLTVANANYSDTYIASGEGEETFCNKFNYHAYRYIHVSGLDRQPELDDITAYLIYTGYQDRSAFVCSDPDINAIHDMVHYTFPNLSLGGYSVDCPHLERKGYGGDGNASIVAAQMMYDLYPLYHNWIQAYADSQRPDGGLPHAAPCPSGCGGGPYWCAFIATAPWQTYVQYGNREMLERYYPNMQLYLKYAESYMPNGLLTLDNRWPNTDYRHWFLGDWALPNEEHQLDQQSIDCVNSCSMSWVYETMAKVAKVLGKDEDSRLYEQKHQDINRKIHETYFNATKGYYATGMQIDQCFPQLVGATPKALSGKIQQSLRALTHTQFDDHLFTGLVGITILTQWLTKQGDAELMYKMLSQHSYPGYLYMIDNGATTTWEHWEATRSRIHNCYNGIGSWFYQALGGILPDEQEPAYRHFYLHPQPVEGISYVRVAKNTPYGHILVEWNKTSTTFDMKIEVPAGTTATLTVPFKAKSVKSPATGLIRYGLVYSEQQRDRRTDAQPTIYDVTKPIELPCGKYRIVYEL